MKYLPALMKTGLYCMLLLYPANKLLAQEKPPISFGNITPNDFTLNSPVIDSNTSAVIIADMGNTRFEGNKKGWFDYIYKRQTRIKIIDKKGFDLATVILSLYQNKDGKEKTENISGVTYNLENGKITETKLNSKDIFEEKTNKNFLNRKFTLPGVKEGSIIEYTYTIRSEFLFLLPSWEFQNSAYPVLWSDFIITIPSMLNYMVNFQGSQKLYIDNENEGKENYTIKRPATNEDGLISMNEVGQLISIKSPTIIHRWVMKDVPGFNVESYISSPENFIDKLSFQLYRTYDGENYHDVANTWSKLSEGLMKDEDFGAPLKEDNQWLLNILNEICTPGDNELQAAKKIYYYMQSNYTCTQHYNKYINTTLKDLVKKKNGGVGEINLLLAALLIQRKIVALPVLLSTREFGRNSPTYPYIEKFNYVICKASIKGADYYLDATKPFLGFGKLPQECYNGHARLITEDPQAVYFMPDSINEARIVGVNIFTNDKNEIAGTYDKTMGIYESLDTKTRIAKTSITEYSSAIKEAYTEEIQVSNIKVDSFQSPEGLVLVKFNLLLKSFDNANLVYFSPLMGEGLKKNPFVAEDRNYPVEMPCKTDYQYFLNMEIPKGFTVDELPKQLRLKLNENDGIFEYLATVNGNMIQLKCRLAVWKTVFANRDYKTLREFYSLAIRKEGEQIVFKKMK